ncbi:Zinc transporter ZIP10 (Solute carrier family 39 member 10) (Zrt- and Irt-like protein 10) (ZIP-10) [Durusdinium trenchii]|uniref:Zinc transporter ZIP10 (Solute carrier family 39 member 10) (Zrt- and Irt-like protein 10) (ZIP-10) n=1 Tax=Durusdinium trenchii TaxID=1381693 RepID=A0ABP0SBS5_9DINO
MGLTVVQTLKLGRELKKMTQSPLENLTQSSGKRHTLGGAYELRRGSESDPRVLVAAANEGSGDGRRRNRATFSSFLPWKKKDSSAGGGMEDSGSMGSSGSGEAGSMGSRFLGRRAGSSASGSSFSGLSQGCGYNNGGLPDLRETKPALFGKLDIVVNRSGTRWDDNEKAKAQSDNFAVLAMYKGITEEWKALSPSLSETKTNLERGSKYEWATVKCQTELVSVPVMATAVKAVTRVQANLRQVMGLLLMGTTDAVMTQQWILDGTITQGQVLRIVSPRSQDGKMPDYTPPMMPLCTLKRTCHSLPDKKTVDFVFRDHYEIIMEDELEIGVRPMTSVTLDECEVPSRHGKVLRGTLFEGSGFVAVPVGDDAVDLCCVAVASLDKAALLKQGRSTPPSSGKSSFGKKEKATLKALEAMVSVVDSVRVFVDYHLKRDGDLEYSQGFPSAAAQPCVVPGVTFLAPGDVPPSVHKLLGTESVNSSPSNSAKNATAVFGGDTNMAGLERQHQQLSKVAAAAPPSKLEPVVVAPLVATVAAASAGASFSEEEKARLEQEIAEKSRMKEELELVRRELREVQEKERTYLRELEERKVKSMKMKEGVLEEERKKFGEENPNGLSKVVEGEAMEDEELGEAPEAPSGTLEDELKKLRALVEKYKKFLPENVNEEDLDVTLEHAEERMREAVQRLMNSESTADQFQAQADFEKWDQIVLNHPDHIERERLKWQKWEEDNEPKNKAALEEMRGLVKQAYFTMGPEELKKDGVAPKLASRIGQKKVLQLYYMPKDKISSLHSVTLSNQYSTQGLDIVELRAIYAVIPEEFNNDSDGKKAEWRANIKQRLSDLIKKEEQNKLTRAEARNDAYRKAEPKVSAFSGAAAHVALWVDHLVDLPLEDHLVGRLLVDLLVDLHEVEKKPSSQKKETLTTDVDVPRKDCFLVGEQLTKNYAGPTTVRVHVLMPAEAQQRQSPSSRTANCDACFTSSGRRNNGLRWGCGIRESLKSIGWLVGSHICSHKNRKVHDLEAKQNDWMTCAKVPHAGEFEFEPSEPRVAMLLDVIACSEDGLEQAEADVESLLSNESSAESLQPSEWINLTAGSPVHVVWPEDDRAFQAQLRLDLSSQSNALCLYAFLSEEVEGLSESMVSASGEEILANELHGSGTGTSTSLWLQVIGATVITSACSFVGVLMIPVLLRRYRGPSSWFGFVASGMLAMSAKSFGNVMRRVIAFGCGTLLAAIFVHILPEANVLVECGEGGSFFAPLLFLSGIVSALIIESLVSTFLGAGTSTEEMDSMLIKSTSLTVDSMGSSKPSSDVGVKNLRPARQPALGLQASPKIAPAAYNVVLGDLFHNLSDGILIAASFLSCGQALGWAVTFGVVCHEIPQELVDFVVLLQSGLSIRAAVFWNLMSSASAIIGAVALLAIRDVDPKVRGGLIAFGSGILTFLALAEMLPLAMRRDEGRERFLRLGLLVLGIALISLLQLFHPDCHGDEECEGCKLAARAAAALVTAVVLLHVCVTAVATLEAGPEEASDDRRGPTSDGAVLTVVTGTHSTALGEELSSRAQSPGCRAVNEELRALWTAFSSEKEYMAARRGLESKLRELGPQERCVLASTPKGYLYTFPMAIKARTKCSSYLKKVLAKRLFMQGPNVEVSTKVTVPWFLLRPDLVTLERITKAADVKLQLLVTTGHQVNSAAFAREGCPRFRTILAQRQVYQQRLLLVAVSDLRYQLRKLEGYATVVVNVCRETFGTLGNPVELAPSPRFARLDLGEFGDETRLACQGQGDDVGISVAADAPWAAKTHLGSILAIDLLRASGSVVVLPKTVSSGAPTLIFVAGLEGTGHHMASSMGRKHTIRPLYDALTRYLCDAAWTDDSEAQYATARAHLVETMRSLHGKELPDGSNIFFLNTVFSEAAVNMYSFPWGGPRCYLKRFARVACNIDLVELTAMAEEARVDFRVVVLKRSLGAAIVSSSINRNFGTVISQTRMLGESWALLRTSLDSIDPAFYEVFNYEDLLSVPARQFSRLTSHMNVDPSSALGRQVNKTLHDSNANCPKTSSP